MSGYYCKVCGKNCDETELAALRIDSVELCEDCFYALNLDKVYVKLFEKITDLENLISDLQERDETFPSCRISRTDFDDRNY